MRPGSGGARGSTSRVRLSGSLPDGAASLATAIRRPADARGHRQPVGTRWIAELLRLGGRAARPGRGPCGSSAGPGEGPLCGCSWQDGAGGGGEEAAAGPQWASGGGLQRPNQRRGGRPESVVRNAQSHGWRGRADRGPERAVPRADIDGQSRAERSWAVPR